MLKFDRVSGTLGPTLIRVLSRQAEERAKGRDQPVGFQVQTAAIWSQDQPSGQKPSGQTRPPTDSLEESPSFGQESYLDPGSGRSWEGWQADPLLERPGRSQQLDAYPILHVDPFDRKERIIGWSSLIILVHPPADLTWNPT